MLTAAAEHCSIEGMLQFWQLVGEARCPYQEDFLRCEMAKAAGQSDADATAKLSWLLSAPESAGTKQQQELLHYAAEGPAARGSLPMLQWLLGQGLDVRGAGGGVLGTALGHGRLGVADWLVDVAGCPLPPPQQQQQQQQDYRLEGVWQCAGMSGSMQPIRWLLGRGVPVHGAAISGAAYCGHLEAVQFLHARYGLPLTAEVFSLAGGSRSMPTAQWLLQAGCPMGPEAYRRAAEAGDGGMVLWLAQVARCPWDEKTLPHVIDCWPNGTERIAYRRTTRPGNQHAGPLLPMVRALVEAGCPPRGGLEADGVQGQGPGGGVQEQGHGSAALDAAVRHGHLPVARYLHEECGVGFGPETLAEAAAGGCEPVLEWLVGAGCGPGTGYPYVQAQPGDMATLLCLHRLGVPLGDAGWWRAPNVYRVPLAAVRWMVERGAPWDEEGATRLFAHARRIVRPGNEESLSWLEARMAQRPAAV